MHHTARAEGLMCPIVIPGRQQIQSGFMLRQQVHQKQLVDTLIIIGDFLQAVSRLNVKKQWKIAAMNVQIYEHDRFGIF